MAINTGSIPAGVNVGVAGAVHLEGEGKLGTGTCTQNLAGTFEVENGCFYFCDGRYRQSLNVAFNELMAVDKKECRYIERCEFDGIWLRP
jgi:hypothetical protein